MSEKSEVRRWLDEYEALPEREKLALKLSDAGPEEDDARAWVQQVIDIETEALRDKLALIEVTVALWEAGAREMKRKMQAAPDTEEELIWLARADVLEAHAESIRDILKGE